MTRNSNAHMRDGFVLAESDLVDFLSGSTDSAINFSGSADLHTPIHPPPCSGGTEFYLLHNKAIVNCAIKAVSQSPPQSVAKRI